jgi:hypothetical protein
MAQAGLYKIGIDQFFAQRQPRPTPAILMYHSICSDADAPWIAPRNRMHVQRFEHQMQFLARERHVVDLDTLLEFLRGNYFRRRLSG